MPENSQNQPPHRPTAVDLFCGAGGFSLGLEQAGFAVLAAVDYDAVHAAVHAYNFPQAESLCGDLARISSDDVLEAARRGWEKHYGPWSPWSGHLDLVVGGPPCQGFSLIGRRLEDDSRNQLVFHFFRVIRDLRPRYFVMENVPGMMNGGQSAILAQLVSEFEGVGYRVVQPVQKLNAADYGVPQDRVRVFLMGAREDQPELPEYPAPTVAPVPKRASDGRDPSVNESLPQGPSVWDAIGDLPDLDGFKALLRSDEVRLGPKELARMNARASAYARVLGGLGEDPEDLSIPRVWDQEMLTSSLRTRHTSKSISRFAETPVGSTEPVSRFYRLDPEGLCNTLRAGTGAERGAYTSPRPIHPTLPRVISVREAARIHSFPDWFRLHATKWHGFRQVGNAVPPLLGRAVAQEVARALAVVPEKPSEAMPLGDPSLLSASMTEARDYFDVTEDDIPKPRRTR